MRESPHREHVTAIVLSELENLGITIRPGVLDMPLLSLALDEDLTFDFIPDVERRLGVSSPPEPWKRVFTASQAIEVWCRTLAARDDAQPAAMPGDAAVPASPAAATIRPEGRQVTGKRSVWAKANAPLPERGPLIFGTVACLATGLAGFIDLWLGDPYPIWQAPFLVLGILMGAILILDPSISNDAN
ncbi:hypothetical protein [Longimicrobium terrae]|uniref:Uncharacterized protein n=1 Tax=Longimicrobium terrae TaxID=1639882 RepID=A0A841H5E3_9BACT|nr:hypothetical protein [Longimicrobium terrae]MBB4638944.1 hypothetical protein [Longimicrobium terrae]MBB6073183.1 hypothetical protein [Longimicrobium terrae]NNC32362.1 hypothetical protein [Longimicrobium terrae]